MKKARVGFIGLGLMGKPMALNIFQKGFGLAVYNRSESRLEGFKQLNVPIYSSPKELAENVDVLITMVTGPKDVKEVILGKNGVMEGARPGLVVVDMSTIGPSAVKEIAGELKKKKVEFLDAPVTGSTTKAQSGELVIFVGGKERVFESVRDVLSAMGTSLRYIGPTGSGQAIKLVNNMLSAIALNGLAEGMMVADALGLPRKKVKEFLSDVPSVSVFMAMKMSNMVRGKHPVAFSMANMRKDLRLALGESGSEANKKMAVLSLVEKNFKKGIEKGYGEKDISAILEVASK